MVEVLYIVSVDENHLHSAEWSSRLGHELSKSISLNEMYRFESWHFDSLPKAFAAIRDCPHCEIIYFRINPSESVMATYPGPHLERELEVIRKRKCIVVYDDDHTTVGDVAPLGSDRFPQPEKANTLDLIHSVLEQRSIRYSLISSRIDDISQLGQKAFEDLNRQLTALTGRCDRIDRDMAALQDVVQEHAGDLKRIRTWYGRGKGLLGAIAGKAILQLLAAAGAGAGLLKLIEALWD